MTTAKLGKPDVFDTLPVNTYERHCSSCARGTPYQLDGRPGRWLATGGSVEVHDGGFSVIVVCERCVAKFVGLFGFPTPADLAGVVLALTEARQARDLLAERSASVERVADAARVVLGMGTVLPSSAEYDEARAVLAEATGRELDPADELDEVSA